MAKRVKLPGRAESAEVGGVVAGANTIYDDAKGKMQDVVNSEVDAELVSLEESKQDNLTFDHVPTEGSQNPVTSAGVYTADKALSDAIEAILLLIPSAASALNQLADKKFVQDSVATSTATFRGTYNVVSDLHLSANASHAQIEAALDSLSLGADTNDYCFVQVPDNESTENIKKTERYKFNDSEWAYEYDLNNSGFTAAQWEAINSNITALLVTKLSQLPTNEVLTALLAAKQGNLTFDDEPTAGSNNPVTSGGIATRNNEIVAMITALEAAKQDELTFDSVPVNGSENPVMSGGVYDAIYIVQVALAGLDGRMLSAEHSIEVLTENVGILRTLYQALNQSDIIVGAKPTTGVANIIYRVPGSSTFADWMYYNGAWVKLAEYTTLDGYLYKGIATPNGSPAASAVKMFYFALIAGTYTNFGNLVVTEGISILKYDGANWTQDKLYYGDGGVFDISKYNLTNGHPTPYPDLDTALGSNGVNVPEPLRKGGMSVKFIQGTAQSSDNKYVQYRLMAQTFSTDEANWQGVDKESVINSENFIESGYIRKTLNDLIGIMADKSVNVTGTSTTYTGIALKANTKYTIYVQCSTAVTSALTGIYVIAEGGSYTKIAELTQEQYNDGFAMEYMPTENVYLNVRPYNIGTVNVKVWDETIPITLNKLNKTSSFENYLLSENYSESGTIYYNENGAVFVFPVKWSDGTTGTYTATDWDGDNQMYKGYQVTYGSTHKVVQPAVTISDYKITNVPLKQVVEL